MIVSRAWQCNIGAALSLLVSSCLSRPAIAQRTAAPAAKQSAVEQASSALEYCQWLEQRSMLKQSEELASISAKRAQLQHQYAEPQPRAAIEQAPVWLSAVPESVIERPGTSIIGTWGDPELWKDLEEIGVTLLHTGPINRAGGIEEREYTPTVDAWFDPISLDIDPALGSEQEYQRMVKVASDHHGVIAADLVPLHTGKGADFLLALRAYKNYPGMYTMVEIDKKDWPLLPAVDGPWKSALVSKEAADELYKRGYIPGRIDPCDADPEVRKASGWSASGEIEGADAKWRRWVYLHYFKPGQPVLDWLDPSCAAQQAITGNVVQVVDRLGAKVLRLDAVPFLGIEPKTASSTARHVQHPLSILDTNYLAFLARRLGGWTFQELNAPPATVKEFLAEGPEFSYDFFTRAEGLHALLTSDAALLRQAYGFLLENQLQPLRLVHDLQNHDEITYQLATLDSLGDKKVEYHGHSISGRELREQILDEMRAKAAGSAAPYNLLYRPTKDGVATTFAGFIVAALGIHDLERITPDQQEEIKRGHLLLAFANAMQPGVFGLSAWDLVGALPLARESVESRMADGDCRWINRGGVDLLGANPDAQSSTLGVPRAKALYGALPEQLKDPNSFARQLKRILAVRKKYEIEQAEVVAVPDTEQSAVCVLVMRSADRSRFMITALNFSREPIKGEIDLGAAKEVPKAQVAGKALFNCMAGEREGLVDANGKMKLDLDAWSGKIFAISSDGERQNASGQR